GGRRVANGVSPISHPRLRELARSRNPFVRRLDRFLTFMDPEPHRKTFMKPFMRRDSAEFCSACHKVHLDVPVNSYRWFRGFNDYDNWQASGVSGEGARSFYYPPKPQRCADCHMPLVASRDPAAKDGKVRSHRFAAANTALPFANQDAEQLAAVQNFLRDGQVSVDVFGLVRTGGEAVAERRASAAETPRLSSTFAVGEESIDFGASRTFLAQPADVVAPLDKV